MALRYYLACVILSFSLVAGQSTRYELRGQNVSLKPDIPGLPDSILWKRNGNKVVEFNGQEQDEYGQYENRVSLGWHTAELEITDLRFEDSGNYELEVYINKKFSTSLHKLEVIDSVAKPTISCEMNDGGGSNKSGMLLCSAERGQPESLMTFEWPLNGNVQPGKKLTISLGDEYDDKVYSCRVSNPLSKETATFTAKDCYPENDSVLIGVLVAITIILSLLLMGLGIFCCKKHNKACFAKGNRHDPKNQKKTGLTTGSDGNTADERRVHIDRTPTMPSNQRLNQEHDGDVQDEKPQERSDENTADEHTHLIDRTITNPSTDQLYQEHDGDVQDEKPQERSDENTADEHTHLIDRTITNPSTDQLYQEHDGDVQDEKPQERSDENTADEHTHLIDRTITNPSTDQLYQEHDGDVQDEKPQERSDENTADEHTHLIDRTITNPSTDQLYQEHDGDVQDEKPQERSDENTADEHTHLIDRTITNPSTDQLYQEHDGDVQDEKPQEKHDEDLQAQWPQPGSVRIKINQFEPSFHGETPPTTSFADFLSGSQKNKGRKKRPRLDLVHFDNNNKGDADEDQLSKSAEKEDPQSENRPEPAVALTDTTSSTAAEQSESDKETAEDDDKRPPLDITVTPQTPQPLVHVGDSDTVKDLEKNKDENEETGFPPSTPARNDKGDEDADQLSKPAETEVPHHQKENEPEPADVSSNTMSDLEPSSTSEHQDLDKEEEGKSPLANVVTPVPKPRSQFTQNSPNTAPEVTAGGQKEDANSDHVSGETDTSGVGEPHESVVSSEDEQLSPVSEQRDSETTPHDQDPNLSQSETHTSEDNQQEMDKPVPAAEKESGSEGNSEDPDLYSASHQPQSSTPTKPDNRSNDTFQESPDAEHEEPVQGGDGKTTKESE